MKITFPHMGYTWIPLKTMLETIGLTVVVPPPITKRTLSLGVEHAPETACLPLKINIGNLLEAYEMGADTLIMAGGVGPCRFGLYAQLEIEILRDMGVNYRALVLEPPDQGFLQFLKNMQSMIGPLSWWKFYQGVRFGYQKACLLDKLEMLLQEVRSRELRPGIADRIMESSLIHIEKAANQSELEEAYGLIKQKLLHIPSDEDKKVLKVGLVGEIYTLLEPFPGQNIEKALGSMGVQVTRSLYLSHWIDEHLLKGMLGHNLLKTFTRQASPFLNHFVGGHAWESIGAGVYFAQEGYDGVIQIAPLTCMPEIVAHSIFPMVSEALNIPVMSIYVDEQTGREGLNTRLEAFTELLWQKRKNREEARICI